VITDQGELAKMGKAQAADIPWMSGRHEFMLDKMKEPSRA